MRGAPYLASDDSELLRSVVVTYSGESCLEMGAGVGVTLADLAKRFSLAVGTDLVIPDRRGWRGRPGNFVLADRAACFSDGSFDLVAFNPPYLPSEGIEDVAVDGGAEGVEVALGFLREAFRVVKRRGKVVLLLSSLDSIEDVQRECARNSFSLRRVAEKGLFFERLYVFECSPEE